MRRSTITWVVDLAAFVGVVLLVATGFLMRYALPASSGGLHGLGTGPRAAARPIALILGLTRHEWGEVHFWIAVGTMGSWRSTSSCTGAGSYTCSAASPRTLPAGASRSGSLDFSDFWPSSWCRC